jgi:hypothetical protein
LGLRWLFGFELPMLTCSELIFEFRLRKFEHADFYQENKLISIRLSISMRAAQGANINLCAFLLRQTLHSTAKKSLKNVRLLRANRTAW